VKSKEIHGVNTVVIFITSQGRRTGVCEGTVTNTSTQTKKTQEKAKNSHNIAKKKNTFVIGNA